MTSAVPDSSQFLICLQVALVFLLEEPLKINAGSIADKMRDKKDFTPSLHNRYSVGNARLQCFSSVYFPGGRIVCLCWILWR